jgi:hypothetical protein
MIVGIRRTRPIAASATQFRRPRLAGSRVRDLFYPVEFRVEVRIGGFFPGACAYWLRIKPELQPAEIGQLIGKSERTVYRHLPQRETAGGSGSRTSEA